MSTKHELFDIDTLKKPISDNFPSGEDMSFSYEFDEIKEARRSDDPSLSQGDWVTDLKEADWNKVKTMCLDLLGNATKDIQLIGWLAEALGHQKGFKGVMAVLELSSDLLGDFWDSIYPQISEEDQEDREIRLEWFQDMVTTTMESVALTQDPQYNSMDLRIAKDIDNLRRTNPDEAKSEIDAGKIDSNIFMDAVNRSSVEFYKELDQDFKACEQAYEKYLATVEDKFSSPPSQKQIKDTFKGISKNISKLLQQKGLTSEQTTANPAAASDSSDTTTAHTEAVPAAVGAAPTNQIADAEFGDTSVKIENRYQALMQLQRLAQFFQETEPHSPVSYLIERAVRWGNMGLQDWLQEMIKDDNTLGQLQETLGMLEKQGTFQSQTPSFSQPEPTPEPSSSNDESSDDSGGSSLF